MNADPRDMTLSDDVELHDDLCPVCDGRGCPDCCEEPFTAADAAAESAMFPETHLSFEE